MLTACMYVQAISKLLGQIHSLLFRSRLITSTDWVVLPLDEGGSFGAVRHSSGLVLRIMRHDAPGRGAIQG
jgi:hypothetical protein